MEKMQTDFYCTKNNKGDVGVVCKKSILCTLEVHSSPILDTVRKTAYGVIQLLRIIKAHQIEECMLIGFETGTQIMCV